MITSYSREKKGVDKTGLLCFPKYDKVFCRKHKTTFNKISIMRLLQKITNVLTTDVVNNASVYKFFKGRKVQGINTTLSESYSNVS